MSDIIGAGDPGEDPSDPPEAPTMLSERLLAAKDLRAPRRQPNESTNALVERLMDYTLDTAVHQGELEEERLITHDELLKLLDEWNELVGWETFQRGKTDSSREQAKRQLRPDLAKAIDGLRWRIERLTEQIDRLERDATKVSRSYSMLGG